MFGFFSDCTNPRLSIYKKEEPLERKSDGGCFVLHIMFVLRFQCRIS
jgi:hypothetical protein